ncbi:MAG: terpene synthase family protein [Polyangiaceae bacterium]
MTAISTQVDRDMLQRMMSWGADLADFEEHHAADGLYIARSAMLDPSKTDDLYLAALNTSFTFWIDDRSDKSLSQTSSPVDWDSLLSVTSGRESPESASAAGGSSEMRFLCNLAEQMRSRTGGRSADYIFWRSSVDTVLRGMRFEEQTSRGSAPPSYSEYVEAGAASIAIWTVLAGLYIVNDLSRSARFGDPWLEKMERCLGMSQRLMNDLFSAEKERREAGSGCVCNSVLLLEGVMDPQQARRFVDEQVKGYDRLIRQCLTALGPEDPYARMVIPMLTCIDEWYGKAPVRYET